MPSSMIFVGLVVLWLLILVPAVARHRQEVARPSVAALSGRVLERPHRRHTVEVDAMDDSRSVATRTEREEPRVPAARSAGDQATDEPDVAVLDNDNDNDADADADADEGYEEGDYADDRVWERPPPRYRPGRGGYDPEAAALAARARYGFRQRVVLVLFVVAAVSAVVAAVAISTVWWVHGAADLGLVGYLAYLRRQVRMEEAIRDRRSARMAGTRRRPAADDPDLDEWAQRGREAVQVEDEVEEDEPFVEEGNELEIEEPERVSGTGASLSTATELKDPVEENALPRLQPAPPLALPAGTALVQADDEDPELYDLDGPVRPDYRRAVGE